MAFEELPATGAGSSEAGRVVRASWGEQVRLNFNDHEERIQDVEAATAAVWRGEWAEDTAYNAGDIVQHEGSSWRASEEIPIQSPDVEPGQTSPDPWVQIAAAGEDGSSDAALDLERLHRALQGLGVYSGCAVTEDNAGPGLDVDVAAGHIRTVAGLGVLVTAGEVTLDAAHASLPRIDIVWVNSSGTLGKTTGTAGAVPLPPAIPASSVLLASVARVAADNTVVNADITDKRTYTKAAQFIRKAAGEDVTSSAALQDDDALFFTVAASETWEYRFVVATQGNVSGDISYTLSAPAGSTGVWSVVGLSSTPTAVVGDGVFVVRSAFGDAEFGGAGTAGAGTTTQTPLIMAGLVINSTTPGNVRLRWAQLVSNGTATTVLTNSFITATLVS